MIYYFRYDSKNIISNNVEGYITYNFTYKYLILNNPYLILMVDFKGLTIRSTVMS